MRALAALLALLVAVPCRAELPEWARDVGTEKPPAFLYGEDRIVHLMAGDKAPYEGVLFDLPAASRWSLRQDWYQKQLVIDSDALRSVSIYEVAACQQLRAAETSSYGREITGLRTDLHKQAAVYAKSQNPPFYKTAGFGFAGGVVLSVLLAGAVAWVTH